MRVKMARFAGELFTHCNTLEIRAGLIKYNQYQVSARVRVLFVTV